MVLTGVKIMGEKTATIKIAGQAVEAVFQEPVPAHKKAGEHCLYFENAFVFPGLINSHDHLDFNLFPSMGNQHYCNYLQWGEDIHLRQAAEIARIRAIPKVLRVQWGIYKNVLCGVTTVVQHGEPFQEGAPLIRIFNGCRSLHSVSLEQSWKLKLNRPFRKGLPLVMHIGEGRCAASKQEINELLRWNIFKRNLIGVHGIAMDCSQAGGFKALVWCPDSNYFLYGCTAAVDKLKKSTQILFGTDSTLSAHWDIWHQLRRARQTGLLEDQELVAAVSGAAADVWGISHTGRIAPGKDADLLVIRSNDAANPYDSFFSSSPETLLMVMHKGKITLFDPVLLPQLPQLAIQDYSAIYVNGQPKYVLGRLDTLLQTFIDLGININLPIKLTP